MADKRLTLRGLGPFHYKWGKLWAYCKTRTLSRLVTDTFEARVEANLDQIKEMLADIAEQRGMSLDDLIKEVLNEADIESVSDEVVDRG